MSSSSTTSKDRFRGAPNAGFSRPPLVQNRCPRYARAVETNALPDFRSRLLAWFHQFQRDLPWRRTRDPYRIWLSEIMLQQTRVSAVIPYFDRFAKRFPDVRTLAEAPEEEVLRLWSGLGYYSRARNLQKAAQEIAGRHDGEFPRTLDAALALPGVGAYTAAAILSIAFGEKLAVLDGNVARVLARINAVRGDLREAKRWKKLQAAADRLLDPEAPGDWNQAMMEFGATLCTPRAPQCLLCPVAAHCRGRKLGLAERLPEKRTKRVPVDVVLVAAIFVNSCGETLLLAPPGGSDGKKVDDVPPLVSRLWHFPVQSSRTNPREDLRRLLRRYLRRRTEKSSLPLALPRVRHSVTYRKIELLPFLIRVARLPHISGGKRVPLSAVTSLPISNLTRKTARSALSVSES